VPCPGLAEGIPLRVKPRNRDPGEVTLRRLVVEAKADEKAVKTQVRMVLAGSYSNYYRRMLSWLLTALDFKCDNTAYRPAYYGLCLACWCHIVRTGVTLFLACCRRFIPATRSAGPAASRPLPRPGKLGTSR
jgi:hypothetical protein